MHHRPKVLRSAVADLAKSGLELVPKQSVPPDQIATEADCAKIKFRAMKHELSCWSC